LNVKVSGVDGDNTIRFFNEDGSSTRVMVTNELVLPRSNVSEHDAHPSDPEIDMPTFISVDGFGSTIVLFWKLELPPPIVLVHTKQVCEREQDV